MEPESRTDRVARIASLFPSADSAGTAIQKVQTAYRLSLAEAWGLKPGMRVLEIGCGQGDMATALADVVGPKGFVVATDPASGDYGSPVTLRDSTAHLQKGPLGDRLDFRLEFDLKTAQFAEGEFDAVVLAHCAWYFPSTEELQATLTTVRQWIKPGGKVCVAEWDLQPQRQEQVPHLMAVLVQGGLMAAGLEGQGNIRTVVSRPEMMRIVKAAGWKDVESQRMDTAGMQDGGWELYIARATVLEAEKQGLPKPVLAVARSQLDVMEALKHPKRNPALPAFAISGRL